MPTFPNLGQNPLVEPWEEAVAFDPTIRTQMEGGYKHTRARFTRIPDKWHVEYKCPAADKALLRAFEKTVKVGSDIFTWTNPVDNTGHSVRFLAPLKYKMSSGNENYWKIDFDLEEV